MATLDATAAVSSHSRTITVDRGQEDLPGTAASRLARPLDRLPRGARPSAVGKHLVPAVHSLRVDGGHHCLRSVATSQGRQNLGVFERGSVECDLVGAGVERGRGVVFSPYPAADGEGDEEFRRHLSQRLAHRAPPLNRGGHVEDHELVDPFRVVTACQRGGIAGVRQSLELHAFDDAAVADIETGDEALT